MNEGSLLIPRGLYLRYNQRWLPQSNYTFPGMSSQLL
jgi:hypothetical protein